MEIPQPFPWILLGVSALLFLQTQSASSLHLVDGVHALYALPLPARTEFEAVVSQIRPSGSALVFEATHLGSITCYWRHPPALLPFFSGDTCRIHARIEQTVQGKLCIVEKVSACVH